MPGAAPAELIFTLTHSTTIEHNFKKEFGWFCKEEHENVIIK
jgi:hypothetical protein